MSRQLTKKLFSALLCAAAYLIAASPAGADEITELSTAAAGKTVEAVRYSRGETEVSQERIPSDARIAPGSTLDSSSVADAVRALYRQGVYSHVDVTSSQDEDTVRLVFHLTPVLIVRDAEFYGVTAYEPRELRRIAGLRRGKRVDTGSILRAAAKLEEAFHQAGYYNPIIDVTLRQSRVLSSVLVRFTVSEGRRSVVRTVNVSGTIPDELSSTLDAFMKRARGAFASKRRIEELRRELLRRLREEGYLEAIVRLEGLRYLQESGDVALELLVEPREPIQILFSGNSNFSSEELIDLLELDTRTAPFGPNAIPNFVRDIKDLYERSGYYQVQVSHKAMPDEGTRRTHKIEIVEGPRTRIESLSFEGNNSFGEEKLSSLISTSEAGGFFTPWRRGYLIDRRLENDIEALEKFYRSNGFFDAKVTSDAELSEDDESLAVKFIVEEGPRTTVNSVLVTWVDAANPEHGDIISKLLTITPDIKLGDVLSVSALESARSSLLSDIHAFGFPQARVTPSYDVQSGEVQFQVSLGPQVTISEIVIRGNRATLHPVIRRELLVEPNGPWNPELIRESEHSLYKLGVFQNVKLEPEDGVLDQDTESLAVSLIERDTGGFAAGLSYNTEDGLGVLAELSQRNVFGRAHRFSLSTELFFQNGDRLIDAARGRIGYNLPRFISRNGELYSELFAQEEVEFSQSFSYDRYGASTVYRHEFSEALSGNLGYTIFNENVFDVPASIIAGPNDVGHTLYSGIRSEVIYDKRNDIYNPSKGFQSRISVYAMPEELGSDASLVGAELSQSYYTELSESLVWANNLRGEIVEPVGNTDVVPLGRRLFLGGRNTLRGYSPNSIAAKADDGNVAGGDASLVFNTELQYEIAQDVVLLTFLDVGQAVLRYEGDFGGDTKSFFGDLRYSPGIGMRYRSPIGPIGADLGFAVNQERGEEFARLSIHIGGTF